MASEGIPVSGGVTLLHKECEGKHSYEVKGFLNYNKGMFTSKGDKLLMINNINVEDLTPEAFADHLVEGSPLLTIHHSRKTKTEECESEELRVNKKEPTLMSFSLMMVRESELEAYGSQEPSPSQPEEDIEDDSFDDEDLLIISMDDTSFSMVLARGCDPDNPCNNCGKANCKFNEVVVVPARAEVTSGMTNGKPNGKKICHQLLSLMSFEARSRRKLSLLKQKDNFYIKSLVEGKYVTPYYRQICLNDTMSAPITIYYYKITSRKPVLNPVVLNFTNTDNFFSCTTKQGVDTKILTVTQYKKRDLQTICADDPEKWSFVFYMSTGANNLRQFESALHRGWFIYTKNVDEVDMLSDEQVYSKPNTFFVIIQSEKH